MKGAQWLVTLERAFQIYGCTPHGCSIFYPESGTIENTRYINFVKSSNHPPPTTLSIITNDMSTASVPKKLGFPQGTIYTYIHRHKKLHTVIGVE